MVENSTESRMLKEQDKRDENITISSDLSISLLLVITPIQVFPKSQPCPHSCHLILVLRRFWGNED
jgi:hypothetical protein